VNWNAVIAVFLFIITDIFVWFQINAQFLNGWWKSHSLLLCAILAFPIAFGYYFSWSYAVAAFGSWWGVRFIAFALTFMVFPVLTYYLLGESFLTSKTLICTLLAICILGVQAYLK
jgi:hypothetical protein|tara:strand:+ start:939 stop:1286 length:348 start_codon:yes stop_codon:yes gene_type:complete